DTNPPTDIAAVAGIGSFLGAISDYLRGAYALIPTNGEEIPTPNIAGAKSTTYRIAVVGPGVSLGDFSSLTEVEQDKEVEETVETLIYEVSLPLIAAILVPTAKISTELNDKTNSAIKDVLTTLASDARVKAAARSGDARAVYDIISADLVQSTLLTEKLTEGAVELLGLAGKNAAPAAVAEVAEKLTLPIELVDGGIAVFDYAGIAKDTTVANKGDLFTITTTDGTTTFLPAVSNIATSATLALTAAVHPPPTDLVVYKYTNTAIFGHLTDNTGSGHLDNFSSSSPNVTYTAGSNGGGSDTITVTPQLVVTGQPNTDLTTATASVTVGAPPTPTPPPAVVTSIALTPANCINFGNNGGTQVYTATVTSNLTAGTKFAYGWTTNSGFPLTVPPPNLTYNDPATHFNVMVGDIPTATLSVPTFPQGSLTGTNGSISVYLLQYDGGGQLEPVTNPYGGQIQARADFGVGTVLCP
nr:hypothetical protein [Candidatus Eremiobacteraeota bacterium]